MVTDNDATELTALQAQHLTSDKKVTGENRGAQITLQENDCRKWCYLFTANVTVSFFPDVLKALA
jgi:hypothetical protein